MGARFNGECFADAVSAASAQCASTSGATAVGFMQCTSVGGTAEAPTLELSTLHADATTTTASVGFPVFACDPFEPYADALSLYGFAIPAVLGVVLIREFIWRFLRPQ